VTDIYDEIREERKRQHDKWGQQDLPDIDPYCLNPSSVIMLESDLKWCRKRYRKAEESGTLTFDTIENEERAEARLEAARGNTAALRAELVQRAAVIVQWLAAIDRRNFVHPSTRRQIQ
jgi:hypothetical protein